MYIFISHSSSDAALASEVCDILESSGNTCFLAPRDIRSGYVYAEEIVNGIDKSDALLLLLSQKSNQSPHVLREIERAVSKSIDIIVYKLEEVELTKSMEYFLMAHQWINAKPETQYIDLADCIKNLQVKAERGRNPQSTADKGNVLSVSSDKKSKGKILSVLSAACIVLVLAALLVLTTSGNSKNDSGRKVTEANNNKEAIDIKAGDRIEFGSYNDEPITWCVLKVSDDGDEAVMISKDILTMKAYDAPDSGKYNYDGDKDYWSKDSEVSSDMELQARVRGNSDWEGSTIRAWLNSDDESVKYTGQAPSASAMSELKNGYNNEAGFLHGFTEDELAAIKTVDVETKGNALSSGSDTSEAGDEKVIVTKDKVYLLSLEELEWFKENDISILSVPTDAAIEKDESGWYKIYSLDYGVCEYYWWLREPVSGSSSKCYMVGNGYTDDNILEYATGAEGFGIRPAITVDLQSECIKK